MNNLQLDEPLKNTNVLVYRKKIRKSAKLLNIFVTVNVFLSLYTSHTLKMH